MTPWPCTEDQGDPESFNYQAIDNILTEINFHLALSVKIEFSATVFIAEKHHHIWAPIFIIASNLPDDTLIFVHPVKK